MDCEIKANEGRSGFNCYFSVGEKRFYADITDFPFGQPECMIFSVGKNARINWRGVYQNKDVKVSKRALKAGIEEFKESKDGVLRNVIL